MIILKIRWHPQGFYDLRRDPRVQNYLSSEAHKIARRAGEGFEVDSKQGEKKPQGRGRATIYTATPKAMKRNAKRNTLLRALGGGG